MAGFSQNISVTSGGNGSMEDPNRKGGNRMSEETQPYMGSNRASQQAHQVIMTQSQNSSLDLSPGF